MVTMGRLLDRIGMSRRPRRFRPEVAALEPRALSTVNDGLTSVLVHPGVLPPTSSGRALPVHIYGVISSNHPQIPHGFFFVTDEYRAFEPAGAVTLKRAGSQTIGNQIWYDYGFSFNIKFPTNRSTNTPDGRHYDLFVGADDGDGAGGITVEVLVPKTYTAPHPKKHSL